MEKNSRVVVVGGGIAGGLLANTLQSHADLVLIDPKEYFEITWAEMRAKVEPSFADRSVIYHSEYLTKGKLVTSSAINVTNTEVFTENGLQLPYDYLVIATGHHDVDVVPKSRTDRLQQFKQDNKKIKSSNSVLIIGGGPSGVELAGEIATDFPDKKVTLIHRGPRLMDFVGFKASKKSMDWLTSKKVEVLLQQSIDFNSLSNEEHVYQTSAGETVSADCYFACIGKPLGSSWLKDSILKDCLDSAGRLKVDEHLRVKGHDNIFAIGDITDIPEMKQGYIAQKHAMVVSKSLKALVSGGKGSKLLTYKPGPGIAIVSLGRKEAVAQFPLVTLSGCIPGMIKSRDLFVGKTRKEMGLNP